MTARRGICPVCDRADADLPRVEQVLNRHWALAEESQLARISQAGRDMLPIAREVWKLPTPTELAARRVPWDEPCPRRCGACSRCVRALAVRARARAGQPADYQGGPVTW